MIQVTTQVCWWETVEVYSKSLQELLTYNRAQDLREIHFAGLGIRSPQSTHVMASAKGATGGGKGAGIFWQVYYIWSRSFNTYLDLRQLMAGKSRAYEAVEVYTKWLHKLKYVVFLFWLGILAVGVM